MVILAKINSTTATIPFIKEPMRTHYRYHPEYDIRNLSALPTGPGCRFLVCILGENGTLIAKRWSRKRPVLYSPVEVGIEFPQ